MENKKTHVCVDSSFTTTTGAVENVFGDDIAYVKHFDFSKANMNNENRIAAITAVASVCYQSSKSLGSESLYNRLLAESKGLPSSSFEFVPVLFKYDFIEKFFCDHSDIWLENSNTLKYGERLNLKDGDYLLTNYRALVYDVENAGLSKDILNYFNNEFECKIIAKHFNVFQLKIDMPTFGQMVRHRVNWQVLSRRYVSGEKAAFSFYIHEKMKNVKQTLWIPIDTDNQISQDVYTEDLVRVCLNHYEAARKAGIKPEIARGIIPQCAYTIAWCAFQPKQLESYFSLRIDSHSQPEIKLVSEAMKSLVDKYNG
jgi:thymidylate synthase (FAD)